MLVEELLDKIAEFETRQRARRAEDQRRHIAAVRALAMDLIHRQMTSPGGWIAVSLDKALYRPATRKASFLTEEFPKLVSFLASCGLIDFRKGEQGVVSAGQRSTIRAGSWLLGRMETLEVFLRDIKRDGKLSPDVIVIRAPKVRGQKKNLTIVASEEVSLLRSEMIAINEWIASYDLQWLGDEEEDRVDLGDRQLRRIFNNGSLELGGRLYGGFWQRVKSELRLDNLRFGEEPPVSLDFGQMSVRTAYSMAGIAPPQGDLYEIPGFERYRYGIKRVLNALLAADQIPQRFPLGSRGNIPKQHSFLSVRTAIEDHHRAIRHLFGTGLALKLMHVESCVLIRILLRLKDQGVEALPIHDCLLVSLQNHEVAKETMISVFLDELGSEPIIGEDFSTPFYPPKEEPSVPLMKGA